MTQHQNRANLLLILVIVFAVVAVAAFLLSAQPERFAPAIATGVSVLLVVGAVAVAAQTFRVGELGSRAVWNPTGDVNFKK